MSFSWSWLTELRDLWLPPNVRRRASAVLSFLGFGLIAGASGLTLIAVENDSDPRSAFAFAPLETASVETAPPIASTTGVVTVDISVTPKVLPPGTTVETAGREHLSSCPSAPVQTGDNGCVSAPVSNPGIGVAASNPAPATTVPAGGESNGENSPAPVIARSELAAPAEGTPIAETSEPRPADALPAAVEPPVPATKPQKTARQQSNRRAYQQPRRGRYAQHPFWPFW